MGDGRTTHPFTGSFRRGLLACLLAVAAFGAGAGCQSSAQPDLARGRGVLDPAQPLSPGVYYDDGTDDEALPAEADPWYAASPELAGLTPPRRNTDVHATVVPPVGWRKDPLKKSGQHTHQVWVSPTGRTAYGVINFHHMLMFLASDQRLLDETLKAMEQSEGEAVLLEQHKDRGLNNGAGGVRFVAEGGLYKLRANLLRAGSRGWIVYAGTLRDQPVEPAELELAERAREQTQVGSANRRKASKRRPSGRDEFGAAR